ncbi:MAG: hypothetical protein ACK451_14605, partial [Pseudanabaena sp.]
REKPYIAAIDLDSAQLRRILELPSQREIQFNVAPDGQAILLNSAVTNNDDSTPEDSDRATRIERTSKVPTQLIVLPINTTDSNKLPQPDVLPLFGTLPKWLP